MVVSGSTVDTKLWIDANLAAEMLGTGAFVMRKWCRWGWIPARRHGGVRSRWRIRLDDAIRIADTLAQRKDPRSLKAVLRGHLAKQNRP